MENKVKELKGVERHIDNLGRLVIPKEMRDKLNFDTNELVDIKKNRLKILQMKYNPCNL